MIGVSQAPTPPPLLQYLHEAGLSITIRAVFREASHTRHRDSRKITVAKEYRKRCLRCVEPSADAHRPIRVGLPSGIEQVPATAAIHFDQSVEVWRVQAPSVAGHVSRRNTQSAKEGYRQVGEVATNPRAMRYRCASKNGIIRSHDCAAHAASWAGLVSLKKPCLAS